jgi:hypothetical protein
MSSTRLPVLEKLIADLRTIWSAEADNQRRMERAKPLLEQLVKDAGLKAHSASWPSTEGYKNLLLYVDPDHHFVINAVVRMPGRTGSVHDHADAWVLYGVLDGSESLERYERIDDGSRPGYAEVRLAHDRHPRQGRSGAARRHSRRAGRPDSLGGDHRPQSTAWPRDGVAAHLRSQGEDRDRAIRPDSGPVRIGGVKIARLRGAGMTCAYEINTNSSVARTIFPSETGTTRKRMARTVKT